MNGSQTRSFDVDSLPQSQHLRALCWFLIGLLGLGVGNLSAQRSEIPRATKVEPAQPASLTYRLAAQDIISVVVFNEPELNTQARVDKDGAINVPMAGLVRVIGLNIREASKAIETALREYLIKPQVTVTILQYTKRRITILGQVNKPGIVELPDETTVNIMEAIGMAGGYSRIANQRQITIKRTVSGREEIIKLDGKAMSEDGSIKQFEVRPGDTITVGERLF